MEQTSLRVLFELSPDTTVRKYYTGQDIALTSYTNWDRPTGSPADELDIAEQDLTFAMDIFSFSEVTGMVLMPRYLEVRVSDANEWSAVHEKVLRAMVTRTLAANVEIVDTFDQL